MPMEILHSVPPHMSSGSTATGAACPNPKGKPLPEDKFAHIGTCVTTQKPITICYQTFGDAKKEPMLLVSGLGSTCFTWRDGMCEELVRAGYYVIRFDNRDVGLSTHLDGLPTVAMPRMILPHWLSYGEGNPPYTLDDMARDALGLLTAMGIEKAHVMGGSMGGMIVQAMAIQCPQRMLSVTIVFSHSGSNVTSQSLEMSLALFLDKPASASEEDVLAYKIRHAKRFCGDYPLEDPVVYAELKRKEIARAPDDTDGLLRQMWAIQRSPGRDEGLRGLKDVPVLIVHGMKDTTTPLANGLHLASCLRDSRLLVFPRMGHYVPLELYRELADAVASLRK